MFGAFFDCGSDYDSVLFVTSRRNPFHGAPSSTADLQLDLMEKDIVIEQLRTQLKQLRSRMAVMEEEQAADTAPLQGLLNQLGELKVRMSALPHVFFVPLLTSYLYFCAHIFLRAFLTHVLLLL